MSTRPVVCVVVKAWPRVSTTFIAQELAGLEGEGVGLLIASMRPPEKARHALHDRVRAPILYLPDPLRGPLRILAAWRRVRGTPGYARAWAMFRADRARDRSRRRVVAFTQAIALADAMPKDVGLIYSHFIHSAGTLSRYAAAMLGLPLVASAHAKDIWTTPEWDKREKLAAMRHCFTCTTAGADHLRALADDPAKVSLVHHGLSFARFPADVPDRPPRDGSDAAAPVQLLSVGRAVEKKGFDDLLAALARLPDGLHWHWHHVGGGARLAALKAQARTLGIADRLTWHGIETQDSVIARYRAADLFVLSSREASDGDRDGLPNVLMEAQSQALACLATNFSAIPELIEDRTTGVLVAPRDGAALTDALARMIADPGERERLGRAGYVRVRSAFEAERGIAEIAAVLRAELG